MQCLRLRIAALSGAGISSSKELGEGEEEEEAGVR